MKKRGAVAVLRVKRLCIALMNKSENFSESFAIRAMERERGRDRNRERKETQMKRKNKKR